MMEWYEALAVLLGTIVFLMAIGMPVALAFRQRTSSEPGFSWEAREASLSF